MEASQSSPAWWLRNLTSRSAKAFHPRPSVVACKPTRVAATDPNRPGTVMTMMDLAVVVALVTSIAMVADARTTDTPRLALHQACLRSLPSASPDSHSRCQLFPTACRCSLPASPSLVSSRRARHLSSLRLRVTAPKRFLYDQTSPMYQHSIDSLGILGCWPCIRPPFSILLLLHYYYTNCIATEFSGSNIPQFLDIRSVVLENENMLRAMISVDFIGAYLS